MMHISLIAVAIVTLAIACHQEPDLNLDIHDKMPPSFSFGGRTLAVEFEMFEVPRTKHLSKIDPFTVKGEAFWKITAPGKMKAADWPAVTYGDIPRGFSQNVPDDRPAPKLVQGKLYVARIIGERGYTTGLFFEIRNGKIVNVTDKVFGP
jgi:hypothetical protein